MKVWSCGIVLSAGSSTRDGHLQILSDAQGMALLGAQQVGTPEHADRSLGLTLEQKVWLWYVVLVAERWKVLWVGGFVFCFISVDFCFV